MLLRAISIVKLFRMMALASFRQDVNYARVKRTVLEPSLDVNGDIDAENGVCQDRYRCNCNC